MKARDCEELLPRLGLTLPTEAQWEYGCRAGTLSVWWTGNEEKSLEGVANIHDQSSFGQAGEAWGRPASWDDGFVVHAPVGSFRANRFGLHDVHGNVWEWCRDGFGSYDVDPRAGDGLRQPENARLGVIRGGGFDNRAENARSASRVSNSPDFHNVDLGVRPARSVKAER